MAEMKKCESCGEEKLCNDYGGGDEWQWLCGGCTSERLKYQNLAGKLPPLRARPPTVADVPTYGTPPLIAGPLAPVTDPHAPLALISKMIDKGVPVEQMGKMIDLAENFAKNRAREAFEEAMSAAQADIPRVAKQAINEFTKSNYATLEAITSAIQPVLGRHGLRLSFSQADCPKEGWLRIRATVGHKAGHTESHHLDLPIDGTGAKGGQPAMNPVQGVGSSYAYACRYLTMRIFNVPLAGEDNDGQGGVTPDQLELLNGAIAEVQALGLLKNLPKFFAWLGAAKAEDMTPLQHTKAMLELRRLRMKAEAERKGGQP